MFKAYFSKPGALFRIPFCRKPATKSDHGLLAMHFIGFQAPAGHPHETGFPVVMEVRRLENAVATQPEPIQLCE